MKITLSTIAVALLLALGTHWVKAERYAAPRPRRFKVCISYVPDPHNDPFGIAPQQFPQTFPSNPWMFYALQNRTDIKPDGWDFYNPAAPGVVTENMVRRWNNVQGSNTGWTPGVTPLKPSMAPYWELSISP